MTEKTPREDLIQEISGDFNTYLKKGVRFGSLIGEIDTNMDIYDVDTLLRIFFVLTKKGHFDNMDINTPPVGVNEFVEELPQKLRNLPTSTTTQRAVTQGLVEGRIDWQQTVQHRMQTNPVDTQRFSCEVPEESYSDSNNVVLKHLLEIIDSILNDDLAFALEQTDGYDWLGRWNSDRGSLAETFREDIMQNIYIGRIDTADTHVTDRMIESVSKSRHDIFSKAAQLLQYYRRLMRHEINQTEAKLLLRSIFITPEDDDTLFELYWIFRLLDLFDNPKFRLITKGTNEIATWISNDKMYRMFHNCAGSNGLELRITNSDLQEELPNGGQNTIDSMNYMERLITIIERKNEISVEVFDIDTEKRQWTGRPDIILEEYTGEGELNGVFIGETKYSRSSSYLSKGLEEILEYLHLVRQGDSYLTHNSDSEIEWIQAGLFADGLEFGDHSDENVEIISPESDLSSSRFSWR